MITNHTILELRVLPIAPQLSFYEHTPIINHNGTVNFESIDKKIIVNNSTRTGSLSDPVAVRITIPSSDANDIIAKLKAHPDILSIDGKLTTAGWQFEHPIKNNLLYAYSLAQRLATKQNIITGITVAAVGTTIYLANKLNS